MDHLLEAFEVKEAVAVDIPEGRERRKRVRTQVHLPVEFLRPDTSDSVQTVTEDLSSDGFFFLSPVLFVPGQLVGCTLKLPAHHPNHAQRTLSLMCKIRIVRVAEPDENGFYGTGCHIVDYMLQMTA